MLAPTLKVTDETILDATLTTVVKTRMDGSTAE
jgi:hypothetical protein